jgi:serine/threonine protein phosphatase PrpC
LAWALSETEEMRHSAVGRAFNSTNADLKQQNMDLTYSGTTALVVMLLGSRLICANVGHSRAILASFALPPTESENEHDGENTTSSPAVWLAQTLSRDHKPDDEDECARIVAAGGRVEPFKGPKGEQMGPCRVWLKEGNVPGLAMSRSLGDTVAAQIGVTCEPEIFETILTPAHKFIILGTDGVWEFLTIEELVEMVVPFWEKNDPEGACKKIVAESVARWKQEEEVIDDITVIVIFLSVA